MKSKRIVNEQIFEKHYDGQLLGIPLGDLPQDLQPTDLINIQFNEGHYSENNSWDPYTVVRLIRPREETPEETAAYKEHIEYLKAKSLRERWERFQVLKGEFENTTEIPPEVPKKDRRSRFEDEF